MATIAPTIVHPTAVVDRGAELGEDVHVGPYCVVGPACHIGPGTRLESHVVVSSHAILGRGCRVHPFAVLGGEPQDRKYRGEPTLVEIGDEVTVREHVTVHRGTAASAGRTVVGARTLLMAYSHVAHDCEVGDSVVLANGATLAGHVAVEPHAVLGGYAAVGQMLRVGESAMVAAGAMVEQDVPPFCTVAGDRARVRALNLVGLRRRGFDDETLDALGAAFRVLFRSREPLAAAVERARAEAPPLPEVERLLAFVLGSAKGVCR